MAVLSLSLVAPDIDTAGSFYDIIHIGKDSAQDICSVVLCLPVRQISMDIPIEHIVFRIFPCAQIANRIPSMISCSKQILSVLRPY